MGSGGGGVVVVVGGWCVEKEERWKRGNISNGYNGVRNICYKRKVHTHTQTKQTHKQQKPRHTPPQTNKKPNQIQEGRNVLFNNTLNTFYL